MPVRLKVFFICLMIGDISKRILLWVKLVILMPFKLGVYAFLAYLFGIKPDYFLSFFDFFRFNLPGWTYNKLVELHLSWMGWFKNTLQIKSINTELDSQKPFPKIF